MSDAAAVLREVEEREPRWTMVPVLDKWAWFTKLPQTGVVELFTRSDLLDMAIGGRNDGLDLWLELVGPKGTGEGYPVMLACECGARATWHVSWKQSLHSDYDDDDSTLMQLDALDAEMWPFVQEHNPHRWQGRLL